MIEKNVKVTNTLGIHARPASMIVQTAVKYKSSVQIMRGSAQVDAKSIMSVMMLAAAYGTEVTIRADGEDEKDVIDALIALFDRKFNEE
ncbi:MAG: HPr family phosphocarrier protein [Chitinispirillales bacterium]|jgi:phosphocarrier protein|nr:HPr family phosphocarrier protein [Chitinispirillales bacterium]